ncbi:hypothetical protein GOV11_00930 [Candidatus Woesearchaeota archaeon]|nr:hypothetical protein [Candidatus Woesearchaeota archaeon]
MNKGWRNESWRHSLAAKGVRTKQGEQNRYYSARRYNYTPTYVAADLPLIATDAVGTTGAAAVGLIPLAVTAGAIFVGAKIVKKEVGKK